MLCVCVSVCVSMCVCVAQIIVNIYFENMFKKQSPTFGYLVSFACRNWVVCGEGNYSVFLLLFSFFPRMKEVSPQGILSKDWSTDFFFFFFFTNNSFF